MEKLGNVENFNEAGNLNFENGGKTRLKNWREIIINELEGNCREIQAF